MAAATKSFKAAVDFYGGGSYSKWGDRPAPAELAANISCPIQGHFGELDKNPPPDEMRRLDAELTRLGKPHEFFFYADSPHGFNRSGWKGYRPEADATSWARTLEFFQQHLGETSRKQPLRSPERNCDDTKTKFLPRRSLLPRSCRLEFAANAAESKALNIGWTGGSAWTALPDRIATERGFFEKEGLKVRYIQFQGTNLMLSALMANELDYVTILPFIAGAATRGLPVKIVAATTKASGYAIISRPDIDSVKALKGKRIAINTFGSSADFAIYQLLGRNGLDPNKDVTLQSVAGSPDARFAALVGGSVDAT